MIPNPDECARFQKLLELRLAIRPETNQLAELLAERASASGKKSFASYLGFLEESSSTAEWDLLAGKLSISETYFFRDDNHWKALRTLALPSLLKNRSADAELRIWCAGCSTGEEPYSAAILMAELLGNTPSAKWKIVGTDLVESHLERARGGTYGLNSFRGVEKRYMDEFFEQTAPKTFQLKSQIRRRVEFKRLNLGDAEMVRGFVSAEGPFDIIFCRNVLIYFSAGTCRRVLHDLSDGLHKDGFMVLGAADFPTMWTDLFEPIRTANTFLWKVKSKSRQLPPAAPAKPYAAPVRARAVPQPANQPEFKGPAKSDNKKPQQPAKQPETARSGAPDRELTDILRLAREGNAADAMEKIRQLVDSGELHPEIHYVFGIVSELVGDNSCAQKAYSQAAFLDHRFSLAHWRLSMLLGAEKKIERAISEAKAAIEMLAAEPEERLALLAGIDRKGMENIMEETLKWLKTTSMVKTA